MNESELHQMQRRLSGLTPAAGGVTADRLIYTAGLAAGRRSARRWQGVSGTLGVLLIASLLLPAMMNDGTAIDGTPTLASQPIDPQEAADRLRAQRELATRRSADMTPASTATNGMDFVALRDLVLERGVEALPRPQSAERRDEAQPTDPLKWREQQLKLLESLL